MTGIASLLAVADAYGAACSVPQTTVSKRALQDSSRIAELRSGACDIGVKRLARTIQWFSDNWPVGHEGDWPIEVPRPAPSSLASAGSVAVERVGAAA